MYSAKTTRAIAKYGRDICLLAYHLNVDEGEGGTMIAISTGLHVNSTSAAIAAGAEIRTEAAKAAADILKGRKLTVFGDTVLANDDEVTALVASRGGDGWFLDMDHKDGPALAVLVGYEIDHTLAVVVS